jgi:hypothetical protein
MFHPKHVELFAGNKTLYKKCLPVGTLKKKSNFGLNHSLVNLETLFTLKTNFELMYM